MEIEDGVWMYPAAPGGYPSDFPGKMEKKS